MAIDRCIVFPLTLPLSDIDNPSGVYRETQRYPDVDTPMQQQMADPGCERSWQHIEFEEGSWLIEQQMQ